MFLIDDIIKGVQTASAAKKAAKEQAESAARGQGFVREGYGQALDWRKQSGNEAQQLMAGAGEQGQGYLGEGQGYLGQAMNRNEPWLQTGQQGLTKLSDLVKKGFSFGEGDFTTDPGYAFRLAEGQKAIEGSAAAKGMGLSGAALKGITKYGQDFASNEFQTAYERALQTYGTNLGAATELAGYGERARGEMTGISGQQAGLSGQQAGLAFDVGTNRANIATGVGQDMSGMAIGQGKSLADLETQAGNARASGYIGAANAYNDMIGGMAGSAAQLLPGGTLADLLKRKQGLQPVRTGYSV